MNYNLNTIYINFQTKIPSVSRSTGNLSHYGLVGVLTMPYIQLKIIQN